jgi:hypothetical protein
MTSESLDRMRRTLDTRQRCLNDSSSKKALARNIACWACLYPAFRRILYTDHGLTCS